MASKTRHAGQDGVGRKQTFPTFLSAVKIGNVACKSRIPAGPCRSA